MLKRRKKAIFTKFSDQTTKILELLMNSTLKISCSFSRQLLMDLKMPNLLICWGFRAKMRFLSPRCIANTTVSALRFDHHLYGITLNLKLICSNWTDERENEKKLKLKLHELYVLKIDIFCGTQFFVFVSSSFHQFVSFAEKKSYYVVFRTAECFLFVVSRVFSFSFIIV